MPQTEGQSGEPIRFKNAYYIKLGASGKWEADSIQTGRARIGWSNIPLDWILAERWTEIEQKSKERMGKGTATRDFRALKAFSTSGDADAWITFYESKLWWGRLKGQVKEDNRSKYREVDGGWHNTDIRGNQLLVHNIPGRLASLQAYRATICVVHAGDVLERLINATPSPEYLAIVEIKEKLAIEVAKGIKELHWKDFEVLVDLVFRQAGWRRTSILGETVKSFDLNLEEPITGDEYQVQVKSKATRKDFDKCCTLLDRENFRKLYFVVHTPDKALRDAHPTPDEKVELILAPRLADLVIDGGLVGWLLQKIR
jgi:hypothetical protein